MSVESNVARVGGVSFLRIPAEDPHRAAAFYRAVLGWTVDEDRPEPAFRDGTGHVIGHFVADQAAAGEAGIRPYVFVEDVRQVMEEVKARGGGVTQEPYAEGELTIATFEDPEGNVVGVWQIG